MKQQSVVNAGQVQPSWSFQVLPSLYQHSQKVAFRRKFLETFRLIFIIILKGSETSVD